MVRRRFAVGIGLALIIVIVLVVSGCLKSEAHEELKDYNRNVGLLAQESNEQVSGPLFTTLAAAAGKSALTVQVQVDQLHIQAQNIAAHAKGLSVPGAMTEAQRDLLLALDLRVEGLAKVASLLPTALAGQGKAGSQAATEIAGAMELFLSSDVIYSQRVAPLIQQTLAANGIQGLATAASRFLPNLGWLDPSTVTARVTGQASSTGQAQAVTGNHGSALKGVSVGSRELEVEPGLNHISGGTNPTFVVNVENSGEFPETNVKVDVTVSETGGKSQKASYVIEKTEPEKIVKVDVPVAGVPLGVAAKVNVTIDGVPGENDLENNKGTFLAIFS
jgi:hypothetical protein